MTVIKYQRWNIDQHVHYGPECFMTFQHAGHIHKLHLIRTTTVTSLTTIPTNEPTGIWERILVTDMDDGYF